MEFIKQMKKREFIEMGLKTLAAVMAAFLAIILMEGMIYSIKLNALKTKSTTATKISGSTIAYCIQEDDNKYFVIYKNYDHTKNEYYWNAQKDKFYTKEQCLAMQGTEVKEIVMHAPNAFEFTITPTHYIVMTVFVAAVAGFFTYKFIILGIQYKKIEDDFHKNGTIEFN